MSVWFVFINRLRRLKRPNIGESRLDWVSDYSQIITRTCQSNGDAKLIAGMLTLFTNVRTEHGIGARSGSGLAYGLFPVGDAANCKSLCLAAYARPLTSYG